MSEPVTPANANGVGLRTSEAPFAAADGYAAPWDTARVIQVIETTIARRGEGKDASNPVRVITQYWTLDGRLIVEADPCQRHTAGADLQPPPNNQKA